MLALTPPPRQPRPPQTPQTPHTPRPPADAPLRPDEFLNKDAGKTPASAADRSAVVLWVRQAPGASQGISIQLTGSAARSDATPPWQVHLLPEEAPTAALHRRTVTHLVPPWHRQERPASYGIAGNVAVGLGLFGLTTGLLCRNLLACEEDTNIALSAAALGTLAGVAATGMLELMGWRPLERPLVYLHRGLRQLGASLLRPSVAEQLRAIVQEARESTLTSDGLDAVLARCEQAMAGCSPQERRASALHEIVLNLIPAATGSYSGPLADLVRSRVQALSPEPAPGPVPAGS